MNFSVIFLAIFVLFGVGCAGTYNSNLESARFNLDRGNYSAAITEASAALAAKPGDREASQILASAYFGRSGLDFLNVLEGILDLDTASVSNFQAIADVFPDEADLDDLRSAIETLEALTGIPDDETAITEENLADIVFDLATMQAIEHFALGIFQSGYFTSLDVTDITEEARADVQADLVAFDNRLIAAGLSAEDNDFIAEVRQTFCILEPISPGEGFTLAEYQALVGCQLSDSPNTFDTASLTADIANCAALNPDGQGQSVQDCYDADTGL